MNDQQLRAFEFYYKNKSIDYIKRELHKSDATIKKWIQKFDFDRMCTERSNVILASTEKELVEARLDVITAVRNSFSRKIAQRDVFGNVVNTIPIETSTDLKNLAAVLSSFEPKEPIQPVTVNVNDNANTVNVPENVLKELGLKMCNEAETKA